MKINYSLLNQELHKYLKDISKENFIFPKSINNIIINNRIDKEFCDFKEPIQLCDSIDMAYTFFEYISPQYLSHFEKRLSDGTFVFSKQYDIGYSYYDFNEKKPHIIIPIRNNVEDSFTIIHELLHETNMDVLKDNACRALFTEAISILGEMIYRDFLIDNDVFVQDSNSRIVNIFLNIVKFSVINDFEIKLAEYYMDNGNIDDASIDIINKSLKHEEIDELFKSFLGDGCYSLDTDYLYVIGILFSCLICQKSKDNSDKINTLIRLNSIINNSSFDEIINSFGIQRENKFDDNLILSDSSLDTLNKCYVKELKKYFN